MHCDFSSPKHIACQTGRRGSQTLVIPAHTGLIEPQPTSTHAAKTNSPVLQRDGATFLFAFKASSPLPKKSVSGRLSSGTAHRLPSIKLKYQKLHILYTFAAEHGHQTSSL